MAGLSIALTLAGLGATLAGCDSHAPHPTPETRPGYFADPPKTPPGAALCSRTMFAVVTVIAAALVDLFRSRRSLLPEIALLRHQLTVLERSVARPHVTRLDLTRASGKGPRCPRPAADADARVSDDRRSVVGPTRRCRGALPRVGTTPVTDAERRPLAENGRPLHKDGRILPASADRDHMVAGHAWFESRASLAVWHVCRS